MTTETHDQLYNLLPTVLRSRDSGQGEPLRALMAIVQQEFDLLDEDIRQLSDNWFIETCDEWVIPYIGDLMGIRNLNNIGEGILSLRAYVANTLRYRRRKGTAAVLEQLALDVTGWRARVVEYFQLLNTTQHLNHLRPANLQVPDLRDTASLELLNGALETTAHTAEVRHIDNGRGRYNIPNIGLFLWRLQSYPVQSSRVLDSEDIVRRATARAAVEPNDGRFHFNPLGKDAPLFNRPQTERDISHLAREENLPGPLRRRPLYDELEAHRQALADAAVPQAPVYFGDLAQSPERSPVFEVFIDGSALPIPSEEVLICNLSDLPAGDWPRPAPTRTYRKVDNSTTPPTVTDVDRPIAVAVDPVLGRIAFPAGVTPALVEVSYSYGFSADMGGGPYDRRDSLARSRPTDTSWELSVSAQQPAVPGVSVATLTEAIDAWNALPAGTAGVITVQDSASYEEDLTAAHAIEIPEGSRLLLAGAANQRPHLRGSIAVHGAAAAASLNPGSLLLNGLLIEGDVNVLVGNLGRVALEHCSVAPETGSLAVNPSVVQGNQNTLLKVELERSICGPISLPDSVRWLSVHDSIVSSGADSDFDAAAVSALGAETDIQRCTVLGKTDVHTLEAGNSIFTGKVEVLRRQDGCARYCFVPQQSRTPQRFRCQPDLAIQDVDDPAGIPSAVARMAPAFTSLLHSHPAYCQLTSGSPEGIREGAEDGVEMGAFNHLRQPQRLANLRQALEEYLRVGLEAGIRFAT